LYPVVDGALIERRGWKDGFMELKPTQEASGQRRMPLEGIRVVDFSWIQAGPWVGRYFANYGAEVIMIADLRDPEYAEAIVAVKGVVPGRGTSHGSAKDSVSKLSDVRERMQHVEAVWQAFLRTHTKQELFVGAQTRGVVLMPVNTVKDIIEDIGLQERNYFVHVLHPELGAVPEVSRTSIPAF
jgi:crotonobetainyl-CoA:carnitine CoA-transferase CaiB-like acyl-CoA transferase